MRQLQTIFFFIIFSVFSASAQQIKDAEQLFNKGQYAASLEIYQKLVKQQPASATLQYRIGRCLLMLDRNEEAIRYMQYATDKKTAKAPYFLGQALFRSYRFDEAAAAFERYITESNDSMANADLQRARLGRNLLERVERVTFVDSVVVAKNDMFAALALSSEIGSIRYASNESSACGPLAEFISGRGDRRFEAKARGASSDLYMSNRLLDGWEEALRLPSEINSDSCENFPFVLDDGITLYFGSKGHGSLGGYDIFFSRMNSSGRFLLPQNVGMPFNSIYNDYFMAIDEVAQIGWFATDRYQKAGKVMVYKFIPNAIKELIETDSLEERLAAAQMRRVVLKRQAVKSDAVSKHQSQPMQPSFAFVVTDTIVYYSLNDFLSEQAKADYQTLETELKQLTAAKQALDALRSEFQSVDASQVDALSQRILSQEASIAATEKRLEALANELRRVEIEVLQEGK